MNSELGTIWAPRVLSLLRVMAGLLLLQHGTQKFLGIPVWQNPPMWSMPWWAGVIELVGGILIVLGLFTRPAAFLASGMLAVAYFTAHAPQGLFPIANRGELAALYCFVFLYISVAGPGPFSLDAILKRDRRIPAWA